MNITVVSPFVFWLFFYSAALMGIYFGYIPGQKAAQLAPIAVERK